MFYIHQATCISPQHTFDQPDLDRFVTTANGQLHALEPGYAGVPQNVLRRMGKAVRMGVGAATLLLADKSFLPQAIIVGTSMGGMEDSIRFLNQIIEYEEGQLTPTNFVQSTANAIAAQIGLLTGNKCYNATHVHRGHAFETAAIDAAMLVRENPGAELLLGAVDEISDYNYNIDWLAGSFKKEPVGNNVLFDAATPGTIAGEGSAMFRISSHRRGAIAKVDAITVFQSPDAGVIRERLKQFIDEQPAPFDLLVTGENGDSRLADQYVYAESLVSPATPVARFKHLAGEYPTVMAFAVWLVSEWLKNGHVQAHALKHGTVGPLRRVLLYNNYRGLQHSLMAISR